MLKLDEIGYWTEVKLDIIRKYAQAYSTIMTTQQTIRKHLYIDGFSGAGVHISKRTQKYVLGSPLNALNVKPPFDEFYFIDLDGGRAEKLRQLSADNFNVHVYEGDCNKLLLKDIFPLVKWSDHRRALCLLDPYDIDLNWEAVYTAGQMKSIEIFLNFQVMDMNMNVLWKNPKEVKPKQLARMDAFWGDRSWKNVAYTTTQGLFEPIEERTNIRSIAKAFQKRLKDVAGFNYVPDPLPMRNTLGGIIYYLFFASPNKTGAKIVKEIYDKYRERGVP